MENKSLKLISLNTWAGRSLYPLMRFFRKRAGDADIFCLQEVFSGNQKIVDERHPDEHLCGTLFDKISGELGDFKGSFACFDDDPDHMSLALFARKNIALKEIKDFFVYKIANPQVSGSAVFTSRKVQYATFNLNGRECLVANYHGLWGGGTKTDTPERIEQSNKLKKFLDGFSGPKIICGDFNLLPDTESMSILEQGMRNLVKDYKVESTRTVLYRHYNDPNQLNFADYMLVSPEIIVKDFKVLPDIVSDHSPLYLEFEVSEKI